MTPEEIEEKEKKLAEMETDIQKKCEELDQERAKLDKEAVALNEKKLEIENLIGLTDCTDVFTKFYTLISEIYTLWICVKGTPEGLLETAQKIIDARNDLTPPPAPSPEPLP